jgi:hypothetical protein
MAARTSASASRTGTTMPGNTTTSSSGRTGSFTVSVKIAHVLCEKIESDRRNYDGHPDIPGEPRRCTAAPTTPLVTVGVQPNTAQGTRIRWCSYGPNERWELGIWASSAKSEISTTSTPASASNS